MAKKETTVFLGTGRRKSSIARVRIMPGKGNLIVNGKSLDEYLPTEVLRNLLKNNQKTTNLQEKYFFEKLFSIWCINPVSCLILCLIAEDFELTYNLLGKFGKIQLNQENYFEYAQLVQVLESKEFISKTIYI